MAEQKQILGMQRRQWLVITLLALSGSIAWDVENTWFNAFVYDTITTDPRPVAWMVGVSAAMATITTIIFGTVSDRVGKRKPFIFAGYVLWALSTMVFPASARAATVGAAITLVIILDAVMTFFGSMANDASFNAWVTDITDEHNRGRVDGYINILPVIAAIIGMGLSGVVIDRWGYVTFFLSLGGLVLVMGLIGSSMLKDAPGLQPQGGSIGRTTRDMLALMSPSAIRRNAPLYLVFLALALGGIANEISYPYQVMYLNHYLGISKSMTGLIVAMVGPVLILLALPVGYFTDKNRGFEVLYIGILITSLGTLGFSLVRSVPLLVVFGSLKSLNFLMIIVYTAWSRNLMPADARGRFQGIRLIFYVAIPMIIGPQIGSALISAFGSATVVDGVETWVPVPLLYQVTSAASLLPLIPITVLRRRYGHDIGLGKSA